MPDYILLHGDSLQILKDLDDNSIDSVVTDPPYGLGKEPDANLVLKDWIEKGYHEIKSKGGFMGKEWDSFVPQPNLGICQIPCFGKGSNWCKR
jgi:site-specific DNA-methyltransferase (adenine-specific)